MFKDGHLRHRLLRRTLQLLQFLRRLLRQLLRLLRILREDGLLGDSGVVCLAVADRFLPGVRGVEVARLASIAIRVGVLGTLPKSAELPVQRVQQWGFFV